MKSLIIILAVGSSLLIRSTAMTCKAGEHPVDATVPLPDVQPVGPSVPNLLDGEPAVGRIGHISASLKLLKIIDGRQMLVRAYWQHKTRRADNAPVTVLVPTLLLLRGVSTAGLKVETQVEISQTFEVTTDYQVAEVFPNLALVLEPFDSE